MLNAISYLMECALFEPNSAAYANDTKANDTKTNDTKGNGSIFENCGNKKSDTKKKEGSFFSDVLNTIYGLFSKNDVTENNKKDNESYKSTQPQTKTNLPKTQIEEKIGDVTHIIEYSYNEDGSIASKVVHTKNPKCGLQYSYDKKGKETIKLYDLDEFGNKKVKNWEITRAQADKIIKRGILDAKEELSTGTGLANDIYVSKLEEISDENWPLINNYIKAANPQEGLDLQVLSRLGSLDNETLKKACSLIDLNPDINPDIIYLYISDLWSKEEFQNYLNENNLDFKIT